MLREMLCVASVILALNAIADPKIITCERNFTNGFGDQQDIFTAILDTDDFSKEGATYELTYQKNTSDQSIVGKTCRRALRVSPTFISLEYCPVGLIGIDWCGSCYNSIANLSHMGAYQISRSDLTLHRWDGKVDGSCEVEDYKTQNKI